MEVIPETFPTHFSFFFAGRPLHECKAPPPPARTPHHQSTRAHSDSPGCDCSESFRSRACLLAHQTANAMANPFGGGASVSSRLPGSNPPLISSPSQNIKTRISFKKNPPFFARLVVDPPIRSTHADLFPTRSMIPQPFGASTGTPAFGAAAAPTFGAPAASPTAGGFGAPQTTGGGLFGAASAGTIYFFSTKSSK